MKIPHNTTKWSEDRLARKFVLLNHNMIVVGKRVGKDCLLSRDEVRAYVNDGMVACAKQMRANRPNMSLSDIVSTIKQARGNLVWRAGRSWLMQGAMPEETLE